ncbi:alpha/beta hydrolase [bacterium]|jgi:acetyl esterase/lipase|nr:alpha/beta hydrolase [bacterium]
MRLLTLLLAAAVAVAAEPIKLFDASELGPRVAPSEATLKRIGPKGSTPGHETHIAEPTITVYPAAKPNGAAVIVCPGGGYWFLSTNNEGTGVCEWLNKLGVAAVLLRYRTPTSDEAIPYRYPVEDLQRALGVVRHRAAEWNLDPRRVGVIGFSAGANLVGHASWDRTPRTFAQKPGVDDPRGPDFTLFVYGGGFLDKEDKTKFREGFAVPKDAPPCFFVVAHNDGNNPLEAGELYLAYKRLDLPAEIHVYAKGGHGFGTRVTNHPVDGWTRNAGEWMESMGFLKPAGK